MIPANSSLVEVLRQLLLLEAGGTISTSDDGVAIAKKLHQRLVQVVSPVIGDAGFDALFARSLKKTKPVFPSLQNWETDGPAHDALNRFCESLKMQEVAMIEPILLAMMVTFSGLLTTFIGKGLALRLLRDAWPDALPSAPPSGVTP